MRRAPNPTLQGTMGPPHSTSPQHSTTLRLWLIKAGANVEAACHQGLARRRQQRSLAEKKATEKKAAKEEAAKKTTEKKVVDEDATKRLHNINNAYLIIYTTIRNLHINIDLALNLVRLRLST